MDTYLDPYVLTVGENLPAVVVSIGIAILATYVALELADRVRDAFDRVGTLLWILAGSVAMGSGIWGMHMVGMSAAIYPFHAGYTVGWTVASWFAAVVMSSVVLAAAGRERLTRQGTMLSAIVAGCSATGMHYIGMQALVVSPGVSYFKPWIVAAVLTASLGTGIALAMFRRMRDLRGPARLRRHLLAATVFGLSLSAMHYMAMASIDFDDNTICLSSDELDVSRLGGIAGFGCTVFLLLILLMTKLERRAERRAHRLHASLDDARKALHYVTFNDTVTRLPNRLVFQDRLAQCIERCDRDNASVAVYLIDLDNVGMVGMGLRKLDDAELHDIGQSLAAAIGTTDLIAAAGPGQYVVLSEAAIDIESIVQLADTISLALAGQPTGHRLQGVTASIGIARYPADGSLGNLLTHATTAAARQRRQGGNGYRFFEEGMNNEAMEASRWLQDLRLARSRGELELYYQPKVHAASGQIAGVEALLRWNHPAHGVVSPAVFIPLAEKFGLMNEIGSWVIAEAGRQMGEWLREGIRMRVAINVSVQQFRKPGLAREISGALTRHGVSPTLLTCEITESGAMEDSDITIALFRQLEAEGIQISIDDFGTGYSSLSYLRKMPIRQLKVDRSFVNDLAASDDARAVVAAIIELAHALRLEVVAEGVETREQRSILLGLGCDKFQGYLFAKPMRAAELTRQALDAAERWQRFRASVFAGF